MLPNNDVPPAGLPKKDMLGSVGFEHAPEAGGRGKRGNYERKGRMENCSRWANSARLGSSCQSKQGDIKSCSCAVLCCTKVNRRRR